jgi:hypothetical protein
VENLDPHETFGDLMTKTATVSLELLPRVSGETLALLKAGAATCGDCAAIVKYLVAVDHVGPALRKDGTPFSVEEEKRHILELKGQAVTKAQVKMLQDRAGTSTKPDGRGCFYCARILAAMTPEGLLRVWPQDSKHEQLKITVDEQITHIMLESGVPVVWEKVTA